MRRKEDFFKSFKELDNAHLERLCKRSSFKFDRDSLLVFSGRFLITPFITWSLSHFIPVPKLMRDVFIIMSAMPVMINSAIISRVYNNDYEFATAMITYSTVLSVVIMPFLMVLIKII